MYRHGSSRNAAIDGRRHVRESIPIFAGTVFGGVSLRLSWLGLAYFAPDSGSVSQNVVHAFMENSMMRDCMANRHLTCQASGKSSTTHNR